MMKVKKVSLKRTYIEEPLLNIKNDRKMKGWGI